MIMSNIPFSRAYFDMIKNKKIKKCYEELIDELDNALEMIM